MEVQIHTFLTLALEGGDQLHITTLPPYPVTTG